MEKIEIKIKRLSGGFADVALPAYATEGSSGMDVRAAVNDKLLIPAGKVALVPTDFSVEIPEGYEIQVRPRSGLAVKHSIGVLNSPGTIDSDYRGEVKIILMNFGDQDFEVERGERIAQLVVSKIWKAEFVESGELNGSARGAGGFGHTGSK